MRKTPLAVSIPAFLFAAVLTLGFQVRALAQSSPLSPGDIVVLDIEFGKSSSAFSWGALFRVHPVTGQRALLSDFANASQGPLLRSGTYGLAIEASGTVLVFAETSDSFILVRIDPTTGYRTLLSDFLNPSQGPIGRPQDGNSAIAVEPSGTIIAAGYATTGRRAADGLYRVDPNTGQRTLLSNFDDFSQGPAGLFLGNMKVDASGAILVTARHSLTLTSADAVRLGPGWLLKIDPITGQRTVVTAFFDETEGPTGGCPVDVAVETSGTLVVTDPCSEPNQAVFRVDPLTGSRSRLSNFLDPAQGPLGKNIQGITTDASRGILVTDGTTGEFSYEDCGGRGGSCTLRPIGVLFRVDPLTGTRTVLSDFGDPTKGPVGRWPFRVEVYGAVLATPVGTNVSVESMQAEITFADVLVAGETTVTPILPALAGSIPGGYEILNASVAFEITTSASVFGPVTLCFAVPNVVDPVVFASLRVLHFEAGSLVDRTILPPDTPAPDFASRTVCARVTSLSPFLVAKLRVATSHAQCTNGGWRNLRRASGSSFKNEGDCVSYVRNQK